MTDEASQTDAGKSAVTCAVKSGRGDEHAFTFQKGTTVGDAANEEAEGVSPRDDYGEVFINNQPRSYRLTDAAAELYRQ